MHLSSVLVLINKQLEIEMGSRSFCRVLFLHMKLQCAAVRTRQLRLLLAIALHIPAVQSYKDVYHCINYISYLTSVEVLP